MVYLVSSFIFSNYWKYFFWINKPWYLF